MHYDWLIIDGYNLLHTDKTLQKMLHSNLQEARHRLVRLTEKTAYNTARRTTIIFDGREAGNDPALTTQHIEVFFSPSHLSADSVIERLVYAAPNPEKVLVVTSDHAEHNTVSSVGAHTMTSEAFMARCQQASKTATPQRHSPKAPPKLGDLFPEGWSSKS